MDEVCDIRKMNTTGFIALSFLSQHNIIRGEATKG
jgi:hypothetical protein